MSRKEQIEEDEILNSEMSKKEMIKEETEKDKSQNSVPFAKKKKRKGYFELMKKMMKGRYKKPKFVFLGEEINNSSIILSNHEGTDAPMALEIYLDKPIRMWGAHEMNSGLVKMYKYQSRVYYHEKKHWNLFLARLFCLIASPLTNLFYSGLDLISTYKDGRFIKTIRESINSIKQGDNIVIFPEDSEKGYLEELEGFHAGFVLLCEQCLKEGIDVPIFVSYFKKKENTYIFGKPIKYSQLKEQFKTRDEISCELCRLCNELGRMDLTTKTEEENIKDISSENKNVV